MSNDRLSHDDLHKTSPRTVRVTPSQLTSAIVSTIYPRPDDPFRNVPNFVTSPPGLPQLWRRECFVLGRRLTFEHPVAFEDAILELGRADAADLRSDAERTDDRLDPARP